jgi:hypothetical protein
MENMLTIALEVECVLAKLGEISFEPLSRKSMMKIYALL